MLTKECWQKMLTKDLSKFCQMNVNKITITYLNIKNVDININISN